MTETYDKPVDILERLTKDHYTTGEVTKILKVAPRTVCDWVDEGLLEGNANEFGYRIISRDSIIHFITKYNLEGILESIILSSGDVADICGCSIQHIDKCFDRKEIKGFRLPNEHGGYYRRFPLSSVKAFVEGDKVLLERLDEFLRKNYPEHAEK